MRAKWFALIALLLIAVGLWQYLYRPDHKYRLTLEVATPDGIKEASTVIAVFRDKISFHGIGGGAYVRADATFVDLSKGKNLVALLSRGKNGEIMDGANDLAQRAFSAAGRPVLFSDVKHLTGSVPLHGDLIPTLITFRDLSDPNSATVVDPNNLSATFGDGYRLGGLTLEMLPVGFWPFDLGGPFGKPATNDIDARLPWLNHLDDYRTNPTNPFSNPVRFGRPFLTSR